MAAVITSYVLVKGSVHGSDCTVFGLEPQDEEQLLSQYQSGGNVMNGKIVKGSTISILNLLARLGFKVISSTGETDTTWTLEVRRTVPPQHPTLTVTSSKKLLTMTSHKHHNCLEHAPAQSTLHQSLDEMDFERGIWPAALDGDLKMIEDFLLKDSSWVNRPDAAGYTALHYAAKAGHLSVCEKLLISGANVDATTKAGLATPLQRAAMCGKYDVCQLLLSRGADVNKRDVDGKTALSRAKSNCHPIVAELLIECGAVL
ncbi:ankyrin repeat domain-containing protein 39-like [Neocloeon triangulifer]|uniref:ankyrin repeat domain-containing protein 39-like n=1 Tax=Neocloeon triangulifer TaxID=2078957 RepID=UPI00286F2DD0|nr:ankyrin repeat domain-containing protein 39-like [Neocloeon triangulifer]